MSASGVPVGQTDPSSPTLLPSPTPSSMPLSMYHTSLSWLTSSAAAPPLLSQTPPTTPAKTRAEQTGGTPATPIQMKSPNACVPQTPEERRERQAAFIAEKNRELELLRKKTAKQLILEAKLQSKENEMTSPATLDGGLVTPRKKLAPSDVSTPMSPAAVDDPASLVSPEKRRAKKLSSLQYPIFSVHWWSPPFASSCSAGSLGVVLLGGGGGKKGAGIDSGMLLCSVLPSNADELIEASSPIRMSNVSTKQFTLQPTSFLDSNDFLIGSLVPHPSEPILAVTVGAGTAVLRAEENQNKSIEVRYENARQTDFHKELNAQAQAWSPSGEWLVTGGEDRVIRVWSYPSLTLIAVMSGNTLGLDDVTAEQHRQGILSLHVNHDGSRVVSAAGDGHIKVWDTTQLQRWEKDGEAPSSSSSSSSSSIMTCPLVHNLTLTPMKGSVLKFQVARFYGRTRVQPKNTKQITTVREDETTNPADEAVDSSSSDEVESLVAICSQLKRGGGVSSLLTFSTDDFTLLKRVDLGSAPLTTMEISDDVDNPFVALANTDGLVAIYEADTMRCIKKITKCHDLPTTALSFNPSRLSTVGTSRWLISASADKSVALIEVPPRRNRATAGGDGIGFFLSFLLLWVALLAAAAGLFVGANPDTTTWQTQIERMPEQIEQITRYVMAQYQRYAAGIV